jgi:hypothetical protein
LNKSSTVENLSISFVSSGAFSASPDPFHESANLRKIRKISRVPQFLSLILSVEPEEDRKISDAKPGSYACSLIQAMEQIRLKKQLVCEVHRQASN